VKCPTDRGGCGRELEWDDGAFCKKCIDRAIRKQLRSMGVKDAESFSREAESKWNWTGHK